MELAWLAAFGTALCFGVSALLEDVAAKRTPPSAGDAGRSVLTVATRLPYLAGMLLSLGGWMLSLLALQRLPLFAVQAVGASSIGLVVIAHRLQTRVPTPRQEAVLLVALGAGLVALAVSAEPDEPQSVSWVFDLGMWIGVAVVVVLTVVALRVGGPRASAMLGAISGLAYGGTALCARALQTDHTLRGLLLDPLTIALVPFAAVGITCFALALQRGSVSVATATQHASMTVVPSAVGLLVLGDHARPGFIPLAVAGFLLTVGSVLALTMIRPAAATAALPAATA